MVFITQREAELLRRVSDQRQRIRDQERVHRLRVSAFQRANVGGDLAQDQHAAPLREWQQEAAMLSNSRMSLYQDVEALRRSDRRAWAHDELQAIKDALDEQHQWQKDLIKQRHEERAERMAERAEWPDLGRSLTQRESHFNLQRRVERRTRRDASPRPWAAAHGRGGRRRRRQGGDRHQRPGRRRRGRMVAPRPPVARIHRR